MQPYFSSNLHLPLPLNPTPVSIPSQNFRPNTIQHTDNIRSKTHVNLNQCEAKPFHLFISKIDNFLLMNLKVKTEKSMIKLEFLFFNVATPININETHLHLLLVYRTLNCCCRVLVIRRYYLSEKETLLD